MEYILNLVLLLLAAKIFGEICERVGFPSLLGYILAGVAAGPMLLNIAEPHDVEIFAELGIIMLLFITGFTQGDVKKFMQNFVSITMVNVLGFFIPFFSVMAIGLFVGIPFNSLLFFCLIMSATDSGITLKSVASIGKMGDRVGKVILGVTVMDGMMGLVIFTAIMTYLSLGTLEVMTVLSILFLIAVFIAIFLVLQRAVPWFIEKVRHLTVEEANFSFAFMFMIFLALMAQAFGLEGIIGAFLAGLILSKSSLAETKFIEKISSASYAIFIPLFFVWTGLLLHIEEIQMISIVIVIAVLIANAVGAYIAGTVTGMKHEENKIMAFTLLPRGDINLVMATIGLAFVNLQGELVIPPEIGSLIYSTAMLLIITAAFVTPLLLKIFVKKK